MRVKYVIFIVILSWILLIPWNVIAAGITLDGDFNDWQDKPSLGDSRGDEAVPYDIVMAKWFADTDDSVLYLYYERAGRSGEIDKNKFEDWEFEVYLTGGEGERQAHVEYHPPSRRVQITLYDHNGDYLWSSRGKWGEGKEYDGRVEFGIPLPYIVGETPGGYEVDLHVLSHSDRLPDRGWITISTVSTYPIATMAGFAFISVMAFLVYKRGSGSKKEIG